MDSTLTNTSTTIADIGPWVLMVLGAFAIATAIYLTLKKAPVKNLLVSWIFGLATAGIGVYGPAFLGPYSEFLKFLKPMIESPSLQTYSAFISKSASGEVKSDIRDLGIAYMLDNPIEQMDSMLQQGVERSKQLGNRESLRALSSAQTTLRARSEVAAGFLKPNQPPSISETKPGSQLDSSAQRAFVKSLTAMPDSVLVRHGFTREALRQQVGVVYKP